ncbi:hypothetical protein BDV95DRAFT_608297 [Massariosphaeria phaeospora]|uniref:Uncharacterized protein n=1 Tax=Massariosphaeria phaeospora TaxID=100035 RepID=A0A7C8M824_9PLEO|nr:hypothetical protein BDV95DRAFT_608297 [Massariosphaeria phaeospora]
MLAQLLSLVPFLLPLATALPTTTNHTLVPRFNPNYVDPVRGSCKTKHLINEWQFHNGVDRICNHLFRPADKPAVDTVGVASTRSVVFTIDVPAYDNNKPLRMVYEIKVENNLAYTEMRVNESECRRGFTDVLNESFLGINYCVVDGTEDVLFQGGTFERAMTFQGNQPGKQIFDVRLRRDQYPE